MKTTNSLSQFAFSNTRISQQFYFCCVAAANIKVSLEKRINLRALVKLFKTLKKAKFLLQEKKQLTVEN